MTKVPGPEVQSAAASAARRVALAENQSRLSALVRAIPDMVFLKDVHGAYLSCNPETERFFGLKEAQLLGKTDFELHTREQAELFRARDLRVMQTGVAETFEEWMTYAENGYRGLFETIKTPIRDADGRHLDVRIAFPDPPAPATAASLRQARAVPLVSDCAS